MAKSVRSALLSLRKGFRLPANVSSPPSRLQEPQPSSSFGDATPEAIDDFLRNARTDKQSVQLSDVPGNHKSVIGYPDDRSPDNSGVTEMLQIVKLLQAEKIPCFMMGVAPLQYYGAPRSRDVRFGICTVLLHANKIRSNSSYVCQPSNILVPVKQSSNSLIPLSLLKHRPSDSGMMYRTYTRDLNSVVLDCSLSSHRLSPTILTVLPNVSNLVKAECLIQHFPSSLKALSKPVILSIWST